MKTAMQELIDFIKNNYDTQIGNKIKWKANELIKLEKQQILDAYWGGLNGSINDYSEAKTVGSNTIDIKFGGGAERYYFETFEGNEQKQKLFKQIVDTTKSL